MGPGRVFEADAVDDGDLAIVVHLLKGPHIGVESQLIVDGQHLVLWNVHLGPVVVIVAVGVGDHRVHIIVGPGQLQYHHHRVFLGCCHVGTSS